MKAYMILIPFALSISMCQSANEPDPGGSAEAYYFDRTTGLGASAVLTLSGKFRNAQSHQSVEMATETLRNARVVTWPEGTVVESTTSADTTRTPEWAEVETVRFHINPREPFEPRWYALEVSELPAGFSFIGGPELPRTESGSYQVRFRPDHHLIATSLRFHRDVQEEQTKVVVVLSERVRWSEGDAPAFTVTAQGQPVDCTFEGPSTPSPGQTALGAICATRLDAELSIAIRLSLTAEADGSTILSPTSAITVTPAMLPNLGSGSGYTLALP